MCLPFNFPVCVNYELGVNERHKLSNAPCPDTERECEFNTATVTKERNIIPAYSFIPRGQVDKDYQLSQEEEARKKQNLHQIMFDEIRERVNRAAKDVGREFNLSGPALLKKATSILLVKGYDNTQCFLKSLLVNLDEQQWQWVISNIKKIPLLKCDLTGGCLQQIISKGLSEQLFSFVANLNCQSLVLD